MVFSTYYLAPFQKELEELEETDEKAACLIYTILDRVYLGKKDDEKNVFGIGLFIGIILGLIIAFTLTF